LPSALLDKAQVGTVVPAGNVTCILLIAPKLEFTKNNIIKTFCVTILVEGLAVREPNAS
jgi:hypothetical protein